ncbi:pollen receptor-like kinase 4 [Euphorbia lathyris]|uniref:pollen receptor-like kinase 4 n=1 Tax=Euphorbia lathyris TaxID=212925 RepID=UPI0033144BA9
MLMGAHAATLARKTTLFLLIFITTVITMSYGAVETDSLLKFKEGLRNSTALNNWDPMVKPCISNRTNWLGVLCWNGTIWGIKLEHMDLHGIIDIDSLVALPNFRTLSLMDNKFEGPLPEINKLGKLKALYLSNNFFSGELSDDAFQGMGSLKRVFLANNLFTGKIPHSLTTLNKLMELRLEGNQFSGQIPDFSHHELKTANFARNELEGPIPESLAKVALDSFSGNKDLCGAPLAECSDAQFEAAGVKKKSNKTVLIIMMILILAGLIIMGIIIITRKKERERMLRAKSSSIDSNKIISRPYQISDPLESQRGGGAGGGGGGKTSSTAASLMKKTDLSFMRDDVERFDLNDLLRASAEVLGSGTFGSSYKASVNRGKAMVVKRYRHMNNVGREEFHEHMVRLGSLDHPNLSRLVAYYYRKEEKLLVYEFVAHGSLASHLHGNNCNRKQRLNWTSRMKIIRGIVRGLSYLYKEIPMVVPHGHLKSSNVLLGPSMTALLTDYALRPVINPQQAHSTMIAYKTPDYAQHSRTSNKTDIWSLGILILEILTGRFPENYLLPTYDSENNLAAWINQMVRNKKTSEVFDKDMTGAKDNKAEMISMLKIGLSCCEEDAEIRYDINQVLDEVEKLKSNNTAQAYNIRSGNGNDNAVSFSLDR